MSYCSQAKMNLPMFEITQAFSRDRELKPEPTMTYAPENRVVEEIIKS
jgi:hypothetical protein